MDAWETVYQVKVIDLDSDQGFVILRRVRGYLHPSRDDVFAVDEGEGFKALVAGCEIDPGKREMLVWCDSVRTHAADAVLKAALKNGWVRP